MAWPDFASPRDRRRWFGDCSFGLRLCGLLAWRPAAVLACGCGAVPAGAGGVIVMLAPAGTVAPAPDNHVIGRPMAQGASDAASECGVRPGDVRVRMSLRHSRFEPSMAFDPAEVIPWHECSEAEAFARIAYSGANEGRAWQTTARMSRPVAGNACGASRTAGIGTATTT